MEEEGRSEKLSDQSEILLHRRVDISNCDSIMGTDSTVIKALSFAFIFRVLHLLPTLFLQIIIINKNLATACSSAWVQMILCDETEVCHNRALQKEHH